jgi:DNA-binding MarR family transcriptional regulator
MAAAMKQRITQGEVRYPIDLESFLPFMVLRLGFQMSECGHRLSDLIKETGASIGEREWRVLGVLGCYGGLTNTEIARISHLGPGTVSRAVKTLIKLGYVTTLKSKKDRRRSLIVLTDEGVVFHDRIAAKRIETGKLIEACLSDTERETLYALLNKLEQHTRDLCEEDEDEWE